MYQHMDFNWDAILPLLYLEISSACNTIYMQNSEDVEGLINLPFTLLFYNAWAVVNSRLTSYARATGYSG